MSKDTKDKTGSSETGEIYPEELAMQAAKRAAEEKKRNRIMTALFIGAAAVIIIVGVVILRAPSDGEKLPVNDSASSAAEEIADKAGSAADTPSDTEPSSEEPAETDDPSESDYVPDKGNIYSSDHYTFSDNFSEVVDYDYEKLLSDYPEACTAIAISRGTGERINIRSILVEDTISMYATGNVEAPLADAVRAGGVTLPHFENGYRDDQYWDSVEFGAVYDPLNTEPLNGDFTAKKVIDKDKNIVLTVTKEFRPRGTGEYTLDYIGAKSRDITESFVNLRGQSSVFANYTPEVYRNKGGVDFVMTEVSLSYLDSSTDVTELESVGYIACCFTDDGCVVVRVDNAELYDVKSFPNSVSMIKKSDFEKILNDFGADFLE